MNVRICDYCGKVIKDGAVKDEGLLYHYKCVEAKYGIKLNHQP
jgi:ribosomal protein L24E